MNYYNDNDRHAAAWLRELMNEGHVPGGTVDERSIADVRGDELSGFEQCHFFAGIGGWSYALQLAGWAGPVWTGSCPCQPYSAAGKGRGDDDPRNLWPQFLRLIRECRPPTIFGEQVANAIGHGWLDRVFADLEGEGYACGAVVLGAHSVGAPHIRQRLFWVADAGESASEWNAREISGTKARKRSSRKLDGDCPVRLGDGSTGRDGRLADTTESGARNDIAGVRGLSESSPRRLGYADESGPQGYGKPGECSGQLAPWSAGRPIHCSDGKARRIEPGIFPLAHGIPGRVGLLRGAGNAIVPQVAAAFIRSVM